MVNSANNTNDDVVEIDLQELLGLLLHWAWLIIGCAIVTGIIGFVLSVWVITPQYESTTSVYILNKKDSDTLTLSDTQLATQLTKDYEALITSRYVLEQVIEQFSLETTYEGFKSNITVQNTRDTRIINITVKDKNPKLARAMANAIRDISSKHIKSVMDIEAVNIVDEANLPKKPSEPSVKKWTAIGFLLGLFLCTVIIVIRYLLDDTIKSSEDIEKYLGLSTLALIPDANAEGKKKSNKKHKSKNGASQKQYLYEYEKQADILTEAQVAEESKPLDDIDLLI